MIARVRRLKVTVQWLIIISVGLLELYLVFPFLFFYRFRPIKLPRPRLQLNKLVRRLSSSSRPLYARFLTCLCETSVDGHFGLKLFCYPQKLQKDVNRQISYYNVLQRGEGSSGEPVRVKKKILVFLSEAIIPQDTVDKDALQFVRYNIINLFLVHQVHRI